MNSVYVLQHERELDDDAFEVKFIGVYSSQADADAAIERLIKQPGFKDFPDGFCVDEYSLNQDHWPEGFVTEDEMAND